MIWGRGLRCKNWDDDGDDGDDDGDGDDDDDDDDFFRILNSQVLDLDSFNKHQSQVTKVYDSETSI